MPEVTRYLRAKAFAEALGIGTSTFWRWIREGRLPQGTRLSARCTVWPVTALEDFVRQQGAKQGGLGHDPKEKPPRLGGGGGR